MTYRRRDDDFLMPMRKGTQELAALLLAAGATSTSSTVSEPAFRNTFAAHRLHFNMREGHLLRLAASLFKKMP